MVDIGIRIDESFKYQLEEQYRYIRKYICYGTLNDYLQDCLIRGYNNMAGFLNQGKNVYIPTETE